jgi:hypothetical protein
MLRQSWARSFFMSPALGGILDPSAYRRSLAALLLAEPDLEVVFIWSPTYLLSLLDFVSAERDAILADFARGFTGTSNLPLALPAPHPESAPAPATRPDPVAASLAGPLR